MADIGTLVVRMAADSAKMRSDLERVQRDLRSTGSVADKLGGQFKMLGGVVAGISLTALATQAIQLAGALNDTSIRTGIATDALQRLQFAAGLSGSSLEAVSGAVARMQKALVESGEGSEQARQALSQIGLSAGEVFALAPDKQFEAIAVAISGIADPAQRANAAMDLFGRSGAELLPLLENLGTNAEGVAAQLSAIGGPVSAEAIAKVDTLGDQIDVLSAGAKNLSMELVALAATALVPLIEKTNEWVGSLRVLTGGGGELEQLQQKLRILQESRDSIPIFFNFGYLEGQGLVLGKSGLDSAIADVTRRIRGLQSAATQANLAPLQVPVDVLSPDVPDFGGAAAGARGKGKAATPEMTAAERRAASDRSYLMTLNLQALEAYQLQEQALDQHLANMVAMDSAAALERVRIATDLEVFRSDVAQAFGLQQLDFEQIKNQSIIGLAGELFTALGSESSKLFKVQKAFAIANAVVNVAEGITQALKLPFPANLAAAAKVAAAGAIQIAKIKATNPGGGGAAPSLSGGGGTAGGNAALPDNAPAFAQQEPQRIAQVVVQGNLFSARETADWLIEQLSDAVNNRDVVFINGASRQAGAIAGAT